MTDYHRNRTHERLNALPTKLRVISARVHVGCFGTEFMVVSINLILTVITLLQVHKVCFEDQHFLTRWDIFGKQ